MNIKFSKLIVCTATISLLILSGCNSNNTASNDVSGSQTNSGSVLDGLLGNNNTGMWDVLPEIDFTSPDDLEYHYDSKGEGMVVDGYKLQSPKVRIPDTIEREPVVGVNLKDYVITELIVPDTVKQLILNKETIKYTNYPRDLIEYDSMYSQGQAHNAFSYSKIEEIYIPAGVTEIYSDAFKDCTELKSILLPDTVTAIGESSFDGCRSLEKVRLSKNIKIIPKYAFQHCSSLSEVFLPDGIEELHKGAFWYCNSLAKINIPDSITYFSEDAIGGSTIVGGAPYEEWASRNNINTDNDTIGEETHFDPNDYTYGEETHFDFNDYTYD